MRNSLIATLRRKQETGFTLVELAIVVAIAGLLFAGLWRLISSGSQQLTEQAAADQHSQLVNAVKAYLSSTNGQTWLQAMEGGAATDNAYTLPLPTAATNCSTNAAMTAISTPAATALWATFCDYLPPGFYNATINPYGQTYEIRVKRTVGGVGTPAAAYEFMILTNNNAGDIIPDSQGGRIAALLGADGGFVYTTNDVCGTPVINMACGAFGGYAINYTTYHVAGNTFAAPPSGRGGRIATRTTVSTDAISSSPWLARMLLAGDGTTWGTNTFNKMTANMYMGANTSIDWNSGGANYITLNGTTASMQIGHTSGSQALTINGNADDSTNNFDLLLVNNGSISAPDGRMTASAFIYFSDRRLKADIKPLPTQLDRLLTIHGKSYHMKNNVKKQEIGLLAQDVEEAYPELVTTTSNGMKGVDYARLVVPIIEAMRELKQENQVLRDEIKKLKKAAP